MTGYINDLSSIQQEALTQMMSKFDSLPEDSKTEFDEAFAKNSQRKLQFYVFCVLVNSMSTSHSRC